MVETEKNRLYQFLDGLQDRYDGLRREILNESMEDPSEESAFRRLRQETAWTEIRKPTTKQGINFGRIGYGFEIRQENGRPHQGNRPHHRGAQSPQHPSRPGNFSNRTQPDKSRLFCTHCGMNKHTRESCFQLVGYPEWWEDNHKAHQNVVTKGENVVGL